MVSRRFQESLERDPFDPSALVSLPVDIEIFPDGWMFSLELTMLYNLALHGQGDILEVGSWIGRSSTSLALGIRDSACKQRHFDIVDLGLASISEAILKLNISQMYADQDVISRPVTAHGGVIGCLIDNLRHLDLLKYVTAIIRGNISEVSLRSSYEVVFCDAVHNESEISVVGPILARVVRPGSWLMCDDLDKPELVAALERFVTFERKIALKDYDQNCKAMVGRVSATHT